MQVDLLEPLQHRYEYVRVVEPGDCVGDIEHLQKLPNVSTPAIEVPGQVWNDLPWFGEQSRKVVGRRIVIGVARELGQITLTIAGLGALLQDKCPGRRESAI